MSVPLKLQAEEALKNASTDSALVDNSSWYSLDVSLNAGLIFSRMEIRDKEKSDTVAIMIGENTSPIIHLATNDLFSEDIEYVKLRLEAEFATVRFNEQEETLQSSSEAKRLNFGTSVEGHYLTVMPVAYVNVLEFLSDNSAAKLTRQGGNALNIGIGVGFAYQDMNGTAVYTRAGADRSVIHQVDVKETGIAGKIFGEFRHNGFYSSVSFNILRATGKDETGSQYDYDSDTMNVSLGYALLF
ncbi:MAG: hypothetical protein OEY52_03025 [Gammaproteobacteria bacterium]|nr:hypothetical protein [Gammaproteobacteria bacterium]